MQSLKSGSVHCEPLLSVHHVPNEEEKNFGLAVMYENSVESTALGFWLGVSEM